MPYGWNQAARKLTEKSEWANCLLAWACLPALVPEYPQNTPRNAGLIPFDRNRTWHRIELSGVKDNYISGWIYGSTTFSNSKTVLCGEAHWAYTGLHSLGHLPVTDESFSDWEMYKVIFVGLPRAKVIQDGRSWGRVRWAWGHYQRAGLDDGEDAAKNPWAD